MHLLSPMKIYTTLNIGAFHTNHCEDFLVTEPIGTNQQLIAVLDGCTMGTESAFASMLIGKILRNITKGLFYEEFVSKQNSNINTKLKQVLCLLFDNLKSIKNQIGLETNELLSTLILGIIDSNNTSAQIITIGDGLICYDGKLVEYEQGDRPDYLGYHLNEGFEEWFSKQNQFLSINNFCDLSISTDGIFTFKNLKDKLLQKSEDEIIDFLLINSDGFEKSNLMENKVRFLEQEWNHIVTDDLAVIRIITH